MSLTRRTMLWGMGGLPLLARDLGLPALAQTASKAADAGEIAGVQRLKLQNGRELFHALQLLTDDVFRDLCRQGQRKPHGPRLEATVVPLSMFLENLARRHQDTPILSRIRAVSTWVLMRFWIRAIFSVSPGRVFTFMERMRLAME